MSGSSRRRRLRTLGLLGVGALAVNRLGRGTRRSGPSPFQQAFNQATEVVDRTIGWYRLPVPLAAPVMIGLRRVLRQKNLYDTTSTAPSLPRPVPQPPDGRHLTARTVDGTFNDLESPIMGAAGTRFGRNVPLEYTYPEPEPAILTPNPRVVSRELLTRHTFVPATTLNLLAAPWLQFMTRDWFSHGRSRPENPWQVPLQEDDPWPERPMRIQRVRQDPTRPPGSDGAPPTYVNTETHWWDGSNIYGSSEQFHRMARTGQDGKLRLNPQGFIELDDPLLVELGSVAGWWVGMAMMHTIFAKEHNAICDRLKADYPAWSDDDLFDHARLINAALMAKIHTVEWTTAILGHPTLQVGMRANWWGLAGERIYNLLGRISDSEVISGIPGSPRDHYGVPYALTEEFVAVYRMHPLIPDDYTFRSVTNDAVLQQHTFSEIMGFQTNDIMHQVSMQDLIYSFGVAHPGAVTLHNFPRSLQQFQRPDGVMIDLAAIDILRSRELGVPRYCQFRRMLRLKAPRTFEELTGNPEWAEELRRVYNNDIERVDLTVGMFAETPPPGFGFSDTAFRIFILMASRRLNSDRFFTTDYTPQVYTQVGMDWIDENDWSSVLIRHYPALKPALRNVKNGFAPWSRVTTTA